MDEDHPLAPFLQEELPPLGLDPETYGPYLLGLLPVDHGAIADDNPGAEEEEWEGVLELLQASSESHSDDMDAWQSLKKKVEERYRQHLAEARQKKADEDAQRQEAAKNALQAAPKKEEKEAPKKSSAMDDEAKKAILAQYAYEAEDNEEEDGADSGPVNANKEAAKLATIENARELRKHKTATKKEEQQKTKQQKEDKKKLKEERRNRATKGERRR